MTKSRVKDPAKEKGLEEITKSESQDICFIPDGNYIRFLSEHTGFEAIEGPIED